jgi:mRNA interferase MazF
MFGSISGMLHHKDYERWHIQKTLLNARTDTQYFYEHEVWWVALGCNIGFEEDGKGHQFSRPVLVLRKFNNRFFYGVPLSNTMNTGRYYYHFSSSPGFQTALLTQARPFDAHRLMRQEGWVSDPDLRAIRYRISDLISGVKIVFPPHLGP